MYTTVQQQNNYRLDTITLHYKELRTFIIYDTRNTKKMAERKYSKASNIRCTKRHALQLNPVPSIEITLTTEHQHRQNRTSNNMDAEN
jgi:hypothetical protein